MQARYVIWERESREWKTGGGKDEKKKDIE